MTDDQPPNDPTMDDRTTDELVDEVERNPEWPSSELLDAIAARGHTAVAPLTNLVERRIASDEDDSALYYAALLLGALRNPAAMPGLLHLLRWWDDDDLEMVSEDIGALGGLAIEPVLDIWRDESRSWFQRVMASRAAVIAAGDDPELRERVARPLREALEGYLARANSLSRDDHDLIASIVSDLSDLRDLEGREIIGKAFDAGIVGEWIINRGSVEKIYRGEWGGPDRPRDYLADYKKNRERWMEEERRSEERARTHPTAPVPVPPTRPAPPPYEPPMPQPPAVNPHRGLGRNEPCWCGSGRKYKQCQLEADLRSRT